MPQKIGMMFTYSSKKSVDSPAPAPAPAPAPQNRINRAIIRTNTMSSIIRQPAGSCSSCGH